MWHGEPGIRSNTHDVREIARTSGQSICIHFREVRLDFVVLLNVISKQIFHDFLGPTPQSRACRVHCLVKLHYLLPKTLKGFIEDNPFGSV